MASEEERMFMEPGEAEAIETVKRLGHQFGFGNLMHVLDREWAKMLKEKWGVGDGQSHWLGQPLTTPPPGTAPSRT